MTSMFHIFAQRMSVIMGTPWAFIIALMIVVIWALSGHFFNYSDTWELVINTATTIITFLMVFLIQNTQNRDIKSLQLKLDELIRANNHARNSLMALETMSEEELNKLEREFNNLVKVKRDNKKRK